MADRSAAAIIVDDNDDMRFLVRVLIEHTPGLHIAAEASDGIAGLEAWRSGAGDVIVTDQRMPGMTGVELARVVLAEERHTPVILYSAYIDETTIEAAREVGVCKIIDKDHYMTIPAAIWECIDSHA